MGGGHSVPRNNRRHKIQNISIPQFPYPPYILEYIMSQSNGFKITFIAPGDVNPVPLASPPALTTPPPPPDEDPPTWVDTSTEYDFNPSEASTTTSPMPINTSSPTTPSMTTLPAYSNPTLEPEKASANTWTNSGFKRFMGKRKKRIITSPPPPLTTPPPKMPPIWQAAISAMEFTGGINLPIRTQNQMYTVYDTLQTQINVLMGDGKDPNKNIAALVYFRTVTDIVFESFNRALAFNYLNGKFPEIFPDSKAYSNFCMINYYSIQSGKVFDKNPIMNQYVNTNDRLVKFFIPPILKSVLAILQKELS